MTEAETQRLTAEVRVLKRDLGLVNEELDGLRQMLDGTNGLFTAYRSLSQHASSCA